MNEPSLFDDDKPKRSVAMWIEEAKCALRLLIDSGKEFTADDVVDLVGGYPDGHHDRNGRNNAMGAVFTWARTEGLIEAVGVAKSRQPHRRGGMIRVWEGVPQRSA